MSRNAEHVGHWRRTLKARAVLLLGGSCIKCGYSKCQAALEFHHRDPTQKEFSVSQAGQTWGFDRVMAELEKCDLVCANCHRELHYEASLKKHGTPEAWFPVKRPGREALLEALTRQTVQKVAGDFGVSAATVQKWCRHLQIPLTGPYAVTLPKDRSIKDSIWYSKGQLEKVVWSVPMRNLAVKLGVSDRAIAKRCKAFGISTPPMGYWLQRTGAELTNKPDFTILDLLQLPTKDSL